MRRRPSQSEVRVSPHLRVGWDTGMEVRPNPSLDVASLAPVTPGWHVNIKSGEWSDVQTSFWSTEKTRVYMELLGSVCYPQGQALRGGQHRKTELLMEMRNTGGA